MSQEFTARCPACGYPDATWTGYPGEPAAFRSYELGYIRLDQIAPRYTITCPACDRQEAAA
jgi:hypothetical protein